MANKLRGLAVSETILYTRIYPLITFGVITIVLTWAILSIYPDAIDWSTAFRPAARRLLQGEPLYGVPADKPLFIHAPWTLLPLIPLALLPEIVGRAGLVVMSILAYIYTANQLGARPFAVALVLVSPPVLHLLLNGNIDFMAALGFVLPPQIGLFFIAAKPQMGIAVGLFWLYEAWHGGGAKEVLRVFAPFAIVLGISFLIWGFWPSYFGLTENYWWNASLWPQSIPVGLGLLVAALRKNEIRYAIAASPCLSPYVLFHSWSGALLAIVHRLPEMIAVFIGLWVLVLLQAFG